MQKISNLIFDHILNVLNVKSVELTKDMYWSISQNDLYDIESEPKNFGIGQLYDDMDFLLKVLSDDSQAVPLMMMHLAPIFEYLSTQVSWYELGSLQAGRGLQPRP